MTARTASLLRSAIEETMRWLPTDPMFSRWVSKDIDLQGAHLPEGAVLHLCLGAANRDPAAVGATRRLRHLPAPQADAWLRRAARHVCLGQHVARAEMTVAINALLDRLPNLRLDPDADPPTFIGLYERGATAIPVVFG